MSIQLLPFWSVHYYFSQCLWFYSLSCKKRLYAKIYSAYCTCQYIAFPVFLRDSLTLTLNDCFIFYWTYVTLEYIEPFFCYWKFGLPPMIGYFKCFSEDYACIIILYMAENFLTSKIPLLSLPGISKGMHEVLV